MPATMRNVLGLAVAVSVASPGAAQIVVDNFSTTQTVNHSAINSSTAQEVSGGGMLGGVRMIRLVQGASAGSLSGVVSGSQLAMSTNTLGDLEVWWDGVDDDSFTPTGLGGVDLTNGGAFTGFRLNVVSNSLPAEMMRMTIWIDGGNRCEMQFPMPAGTVVLPFSSFTTCSGSATPTSASQTAGLVHLRTVLRPGAWTFTLGLVQTPVELLQFSVE